MGYGEWDQISGFIEIWHEFRVLIPQGLSLSRNGFEVKEIKLNRSSVWKLALETAFQDSGKKKEHLTGSGVEMHLEVWAVAWHPTPWLNEDSQAPVN